MSKKSFSKQVVEAIKPTPSLLDNPQIWHDIIGFNFLTEPDDKMDNDNKYRLEILRKNSSPARHPSRFPLRKTDFFKMPVVRQKNSPTKRELTNNFESNIIEKNKKEAPKLQQKPPLPRRPSPVKPNDTNTFRISGLQKNHNPNIHDQLPNMERLRSKSPIELNMLAKPRALSVIRGSSKVEVRSEVPPKLPLIDRAKSIKRYRQDLASTKDQSTERVTILTTEMEGDTDFSLIREIKSGAFVDYQPPKTSLTIEYDEEQTKKFARLQLLRKIEGSKIRAYTKIPKIKRVVQTEPDTEDSQPYLDLRSRFESMLPQNISITDSFAVPSEENRHHKQLRREAENREMSCCTGEDKVILEKSESGYQIQAENVLDTHLPGKGDHTPHFQSRAKIFGPQILITDPIMNPIKKHRRLTVNDLHLSGTFLRGHLKPKEEGKSRPQVLRKKSSRDNFRDWEEFMQNPLDVSFSGSFGRN